MVFDLVWKGKKHIVREIVIKPREIEFDKNQVDAEGNELKKIRNPLANGEKAFIFIDKDNQPVEKHFKAINGKPKNGFKKTTCLNEQSIFQETLSTTLAGMVCNDHTYYLINDELKAILQEIGENTCLVCKPYVIRGFKAYKAIIYYNPEVDRSIMKLCRSDILDAEMPEVTEVKEVVTKDDVEGITEDELVC